MPQDQGKVLFVFIVRNNIHEDQASTKKNLKNATESGKTFVCIYC